MEFIKRYKALATGRVQGVGFRYFVMDNAIKLNVTGWVRNLPNGDVDMELQGKPEDLVHLIDKIKKGNFIIKVDSFNYEEIPAKEDKTFIIKY